MIPEPLALIVTLPVEADPVVTLAFIATPALVPACSVVVVAVIEFDTVIAPPLPAVSVNENVLPVDVPLIVTGLASLTYTFPLVLDTKLEALANILLPDVPIVPLLENNVSVPAVTVPLPLSETMPEPLALIVTLPVDAEPVVTFAFIATPAFVPACNVVVVAVIEFDTVIAPPLTAVSVSEKVLPVDAPLIVTGLASLT